MDKGLDEYEEIKRSEDCGSLGSGTRLSIAPSSTSDLAYIGSEPNLVIHSHSNSINGKQGTHKIVSDNQAGSQTNSRRATVHSSSEDDAANCTTNGRSSKSEFTLVTESLAKLVDSSKILEIDSRTSAVTDKSDLNTILVRNSVPKEDLGAVGGTCDSESKSGTEFTDDPCKEQPMRKIMSSEKTHEGNVSKPLARTTVELKQNTVSPITARGEDIDVGTDALADMSYNRQSNLFEFDNGSVRVGGNEMKCDQHKESERNRLECVGVEESVLVDNLFANVTSRTEALASHATSFNLMSSRHGST